MYGVALRLTSNEKEAEDLVQDAFLRAYRFYEKFQPGTNLKACLLKIQMNVFLNRVKKVSSRPALVDFETLEDVLGEADEGAAGVTTSSEQFRDLLDDDVARALDELPLEYRTPVLLSAVEDLSYKEIADIMGCPVGTVMSRLYRGRKMLERSLRAYAQSIGFLKGRNA
jgi:RNA polymerase sigma-70 factor (ECF subfamily)